MLNMKCVRELCEVFDGDAKTDGSTDGEAARERSRRISRARSSNDKWSASRSDQNRVGQWRAQSSRSELLQRPMARAQVDTWQRIRILWRSGHGRARLGHTLMNLS